MLLKHLTLPLPCVAPMLRPVCTKAMFPVLPMLLLAFAKTLRLVTSALQLSPTTALP